jgi:signal transduction histidine kinase/CheY-like chemotaxis protein
MLKTNRAPNLTVDAEHRIAVTFQLSRNVVVQALGMSMVVLMGLAVVAWPLVLAWGVVAISAVFAENHLMKVIAGLGPRAPVAARWAPAMRVLTTTIYAVAAFALITKGGQGERLFAFALMSASMVHVLMRYYRSPLVLLAAMSPYLVIMALAGFGMTKAALMQGHILSAFACTFTIAMFSVQFWSARAQLFASWNELLSARQAAEVRERAAECANRAKSDFLSNMSHELRTPLNGVLGMAQALTFDRLTSVQQERVKIIRRSSENLLAVLNDLLDLSKIEAGGLELEVAAFDLEHLIRGVASAYKPQAGAKSLTLDFQIAESTKGRYIGDAARIRRILYSLADNAVKFTEVGEITLGVDGAQDGLLFWVSDTGIGISDADLARLFDGFFQSDASQSRRYGGMGIGLSICNELTALMGGVLEAKSRLAEGSTFTVKLPLRRAEPAASDKADADASLNEAATLRVLAAEDNPANQAVLKALLSAVGITPDIVENGREAVRAWEGGSWDIILMDIQMPEMNGVEATRAIRRREAETGRARTPIIAVTANAMAHQIAEYQCAGLDEVIAKPINMAELFQAMEHGMAAVEPSTTQAISA